MVEKMGFGTTPRRCGICSKPRSLLQKTCLSYTSETLAVYVGICLRTRAGLHMQAATHVWRPRATLVILFPKIDFFAHLKGSIFHFYTYQVNLISDWAPNWTWALEFKHHWGMETRVVRGKKCSVYICA